MAAESPTERIEFTIDELARRAGMTVRNVRAYAGRGLLPPPTLRGRTGYYGATHLTRLRVIRDLVDRGFTLAAVQRVLERAPADASAATLAVARAMYEPYVTEEPQIMTREELAALAGLSAPSLELLEALVELGIVERMEADSVRVLSPPLLQAGFRVIGLGVPAAAVARTQQEVRPHVAEVAKCYVHLVRDTLWRDFVAAGMPAQGWADIEHAIEMLQPYAAEALLATFRSAMAEAMDEAIGAAVSAVRERAGSARGPGLNGPA